ncbi:S8 family serine peptidase [bacterium]|nr:S8 family serine peptidase [bacterium]
MKWTDKNIIHYDYLIFILFLCLAAANAPAAQKIAGARPTQKERLAAVERPEIVVFLDPAADPARFAKENGLTLVRQMLSDPDGYVFNTAQSTSPTLTQEEKKARFESDKRVRKAFVNHRAKIVKFGFTPNDPYFHRNTPSSGYYGDWHLINELGTGIDVRVQDVWSAGITGSGVVLAAVDDGLQINHPDVSAHYDSADSWNFGNNTATPTPGSDDDHGTVVTGVAGAVGGNSIGVCGAAPMASLACLRLDFNSLTDAIVADADLYHSSGSNKSIKIKNHSYGYTEPWVDIPLEKSALATSAAAGTIHVFAAGNGRSATSPDITEDAGKAMYQSNPDVIAVAAVDQYGKYKYYSSYGACVFASAPSGVLSTDRTGTSGYNAGGSGSYPDDDYYDGAEGTSFSSPLAAGVLALVKQAQPKLDVRFAKHLLARCSDQIDSGDTSTESGGGWITNKAGLKFNQNYGFGLVNAKRLVALAKLCTGVTTLQTENTETISPNLAIPDNNQTGVTTTFKINATTPLEEMLLTIDITHTYIGDLDLYLTSPRGTTCRMMEKNTRDNTKNLGWTLLSNAFWGENPQGTWTIKIRDTAAADSGTLKSFSATARMGKLVLPTAAEFADYE